MKILWEIEHPTSRRLYQAGKVVAGWGADFRLHRSPLGIGLPTSRGNQAPVTKI